MLDLGKIVDVLLIITKIQAVEHAFSPFSVERHMDIIAYPCAGQGQRVRGQTAVTPQIGRQSARVKPSHPFSLQAIVIGHGTGLAYALSGNRSLAEDLAQEAFLAAYRNWPRVSTYEQPGAWVRRIVANLSVSAFRRKVVEEPAQAPRS